MPSLVIRSAFASVTGRQHETSGTPCQDAALLRRLGRSGIVVAVADGAGSAKHAEIGADVAVSAAVHILATLRAYVFTLDEPHTVLTQIREALTAKAREIDCEFRDLACTLMAVLAMKHGDGFRWAAFHIGDGAIVAELDWTCNGFVPVTSLYATFASNASGLMPPRNEWRLRGL